MNWSDIAREEAMKKDIFERFLKTRRVTPEDWKFCEEIDWHPVDELPFKKSYVRKISATLRETPIKFTSLAELFDDIHTRNHSNVRKKSDKTFSEKSSSGRNSEEKDTGNS